MSTTVRPRVTVVALGGTISMGPTDAGGAVPRLGPKQLIERDPSLATLATLEGVSLRHLPGASLRMTDLDELADLVAARVADGHGVVVVQGTDTLEEVAFTLDLLVRGARPIVVTGAMRHAAIAGDDGPANLRAAVVVAASERDLGGVAVVMGDEVHAARFVTKRHATRPHAFASPCGPIGAVVEDRLLLHATPVRWPVAVAWAAVTRNARVPIVTLGIDDDGTTLAACAGADALVVETLGGGHVPEWLLDRIGELAAAMPVVATSRTRDGVLLRHTYAFRGAEIDLHQRGVLTAGGLDAFKARILLLTLLRRGASASEAADVFRSLATA